MRLRSGKNIQNYAKKDLNDPDNHDGVITHLEPGILDCEVKWALGSITINKASGGDGIPAELFQILKMMLLKRCTPYASKFGKLSSGHRTGKVSVFIPVSKKGNAKECSNYRTIALVSHFSKVMLQILQVRFQQYMNQELPDIQAGFRQGRGTRDHITNIRWIIKKKQEDSRKTCISASLTTIKPLTVHITINCRNFLKRWEYQTTLPASHETCMLVKKQQ